MASTHGKRFMAAILALCAATLGRDDRLDQAKTLLASSTEGEVRRGTRICEQVNSVAAVEALLEVLNRTNRPSGRHLTAEHYRDIVWEGLEKITDAKARRRIERELKTNRKSADVRQWCAQLLGIYGDQEFGPSLQRALGDGSAGVRRAAARALGKIAYAPSAPALLKLTRSKNLYIRANAIEALARIDAGKYESTFLGGLKRDKDGGVRCALLGAAPEIYPSLAEALSGAARQDEDWRPRMQGVDNLARIRTKTSVDALIEAVPDGRPVVGLRAVDSLHRLTGKEIRTYEGWKGWWRENRESFEFPEGTASEAPGGERRSVAYNDIPLVSDHVAFMIDKSARMRETLKAKGMSKEQAAREELGRVLSKLHGRLVFNVFIYREEVKGLAKKPVELAPKTQKRALAFVRGEVSAGSKNIWKVLETVIEDPTLDTAYLLSSGEPDVGLYVHWNRVTYHLRDLNRFHKVVVHTVVYHGRQWYRDQLEKIAEATGGEFRWFE
jgi:HEAT repeat protein